MIHDFFNKIEIFAEAIFLDGEDIDIKSLSYVIEILEKIKNGETYFDIPDTLTYVEQIKYFDILNFLSESPILLLEKVFINKNTNNIIGYEELFNITNNLKKNNKNLKYIQLFFKLNNNPKIFYINKWVYLYNNNNNNKEKYE